MSINSIISALVDIVGDINVTIDPEMKALYGTDRTQSYTPNPLAIVFPHNEKQVLAVVEWANTTRIPIVPSGGRTGYSGGAVAAAQEVVVSLDKMNHILEFNADDRTVRCQAGVITKHLQEFALENNLYYPVDFASSGSSHIGGNIATNAGGIKVIRYGSTRNWVYGLKVVTGNGELLDLNYGLIKNSSGYDLRHLFIGSEGTLGIITEATLKLITPPAELKVVLLAIENKTHLIEILNIFGTQLKITAFEFFSDIALHYVLQNSDLKQPFSINHPYYILLEYEVSENSDAYLIDTAQQCIGNKLIVDAVISASMTQNKTLWRYREDISMSLSKSSPYKYDISVNPAQIANFITEADILLSRIYPDFDVVWFGHVGDGNLHLNIIKPDNLTKAHFFSLCEKMSEHVYGLIQTYHGSISAEHGIGLTKKNFLSYGKSLIEINYMRNIKNIFDINNILNPGKIF